MQTRGLNQNFNHRMKLVFKSAALEALKDESIGSLYNRQIDKGIRPEAGPANNCKKVYSGDIGSVEERRRVRFKQADTDHNLGARDF